MATPWTNDVHLLNGSPAGPVLTAAFPALLLGAPLAMIRPASGPQVRPAVRAAAAPSDGSPASQPNDPPNDPLDDPPNDPLDDQPDGLDVTDLIRRAQNGEREAFGQLYDQYVELVYRFALYRVGGNETVAEDIVSETFLRALRSIGSFTEQGRDIGAWLITIARNLLVDQARSGRARLEFPTADIVDRADARMVPGPEESVLADIDVRELLAAVARLRPDQRECLRLRFLLGMSVRETAAAMGRNEGAVRALQLRAVRALARNLPAPEAG